jgi:hypothetical protein
LVVLLVGFGSQAAEALELDNADARFLGNRKNVVVSSAGDLNADGNDDLLFGSREGSVGDGRPRAVYVMFGPFEGTSSLKRPHATLVEPHPLDVHHRDLVGYSLAGAGDVDGDGIDDVFLGAYGDLGDTSYNGGGFLVQGPVTGGRFDLANAHASFVGAERGDFAGNGATFADVNADGHSDLLLGAFGAPELAYDGEVYLVLGPVTGRHNLARTDATLMGQTDDFAGSDVSAADTNGDGHDDILVGAPGNSAGGSWAGAAYLVLGPQRGIVDLAAADAMLVGEEVDDEAGDVVAGAGDVDNDGNEDVLVGARRSDLGGPSSAGLSSGAVYLVLGPVSGTHDLSTADAVLVGRAGDSAGIDVSGVGDVDADGHDDVLVGAYTNWDGGVPGGAAYLVKGPIAGTLDLSTADTMLVGDAERENEENAGYTVAGAGDMDGDGRADVLVGTGGGDAFLVHGAGL